MDRACDALDTEVYMARREQPVDRKVGAHDGEIEEKHPSFGLVRLARIQGRTQLFGSSLDHHDGYVELSISEGIRCRSGHGYDFYHSGRKLIDIMLSEAQFAQMITTWNSGNGVPCTIDHVAGEDGYRPTWPAGDQPSDGARVRSEFSDRVSDVRKRVDELAAEMGSVIEKKTLTNADREKLRSIVSAVSRLINDSGPFMAGQFVEATETTVQRALTEIDAFVGRIVQQTGLDALRDMQAAVQLPAHKEE